MLGTRSKCSLSSIELEAQQIGNCGVFNRNRVLATGRVIDKIKNQTHPEIKNYWTPLYEEENEAEDCPRRLLGH